MGLDGECMKLNQFQRAFIALEAILALIISTTIIVWFGANYNYMLQRAKQKDVEVAKLRMKKEQSDEKLWQLENKHQQKATSTLVESNEAKQNPSIQYK